MAQQLNEIPKAYDPKQIESKWYPFWMEKGYFSPKIDPKKKPFVIIMPPPNVTGELHLGHALTATLEDVLTRWHRMKGDPTLWLPGVDHASIATQYVVQQLLAKEGLDRQTLGREKFLERVWQWVARCRGLITEQHKRLGVSCDWSREVFTMDPGPAKAVRTTFMNLYNKGLIYRGERLTNWCPACATVLSDLEVDHKEIQGNFYHIRYRLADKKNEFVVVATTRPETLLGDTAVAVNPKDVRYKHLIGKSVVLPAIGREIPIIGDDAVDSAFGTGALKVTPAHDPVDFEIADRHHLPHVNVMNLDATLNENAGPYKGLDRFVARKKLLADLERDGLMVKTEPHTHAVGHCYRCRTMVEPLITKQWFVKIDSLAKPAIDAVMDGRIQIIPAHFTKTYLNWMNNIRDWCISRQLWWGHRIPVWYCQDCGQITIAVDDPSSCSHCRSQRIEQDPDVLDTWFSSGLWTHSTLGWPDDTEDFNYFYPTSVMETGYDILFFWVARMIMMGLENTGKVPFDKVYLHGLIRDEKGEKMSKTRGNVIDPLKTLEQYGTDALRLALIVGNTPGNDMRISPQKLEGSRNFANKLWNTSRFILGNIEGSLADVSQATRSNVSQADRSGSGQAAQMPIEDRWIRSRLNRLIVEVHQLMEGFMLGEALSRIHEFVWGEFCDWYIEMAKIRLQQKDMSPMPVLVDTLEKTLRLLHPFMPFITEEIWQRIREYQPDHDAPESIMIAAYPLADLLDIDPPAERQMESVIEIVRSIRNARAEAKVEPAKYIEGLIAVQDFGFPAEKYTPIISALARVRPLTIIDRSAKESKKDAAKVLVLRDVEVILPLRGMIDFDAERNRLQKEIESVHAQISRTEARLANEQFISKAPAQVVERERQNIAEGKDRLERLQKQLAELG
ncbi:MAG: valine--tRNA ligase [Dehalococcoidia bacterium]|nr:valine--tRNA ligase [Dehalococcoidia bacterium]